MEIDYSERRQQLKELQQEPLSSKIENTIAKVLEFYHYTNGNCYLSCSGGADSIVLYNIIKRFKEKLMPELNIPVVFDDTGLEEPSVRAMALSIPNVKVVKPEMSFWQVLTSIGYPLISKEVSECVNNARRYFDAQRERERERESASPKYLSHYQKLFGLGPYAAKDKKNTGPTDKKGFP